MLAVTLAGLCLLFGSFFFFVCRFFCLFLVCILSSFPRKCISDCDYWDSVSKTWLYVLLHLIASWAVRVSEENTISFFFLRILKALLNFLLVPTFLFMTLKQSQFLTSYEHGELFLCKPAWPCFCFCSSEVVFSGLGFCWSGTTCRRFTQSPTLLLFFVVLFLFSFAIINDLKQQKGR